MSQDVNQDWNNREFVETVEIAVRKCVDFLNAFHESARYRLSVVDQRLYSLERKLDFIDAQLENCDPSQRQGQPKPFKGSVFDPEVRQQDIKRKLERRMQSKGVYTSKVIAPKKSDKNQKLIVGTAQSTTNLNINVNVNSPPLQKSATVPIGSPPGPIATPPLPIGSPSVPIGASVSGGPKTSIKPMQPMQPPQVPQVPQVPQPPQPEEDEAEEVERPQPPQRPDERDEDGDSEVPGAASKPGPPPPKPMVPPAPKKKPEEEEPEPEPGQSVGPPPPGPPRNTGPPPPMIESQQNPAPPPPRPAQPPARPPPPSNDDIPGPPQGNFPHGDPARIDILRIQQGNGSTPNADSSVEIEYSGYLPNGKKFIEHRETIELGKKQNIKGLEQGVCQISEGERIKLWIPSKLAYGERGAGQLIPPNSDLTFELTLIKILRK